MLSAFNSALFFGLGVFTYWFMPALKSIVFPDDGMSRVTALLAGLLVAGSIATPCALGVFLGTSVARSVSRRFPVWLFVIIGFVFAIALEPALELMETLGIEIPGKPLGLLLALVIASAILSVLCSIAMRLFSARD